jgi:hypothetical protein
MMICAVGDCEHRQMTLTSCTWAMLFTVIYERVIIIITGTTALCEPWPFSGFLNNFYGVRLSASRSTPNLEDQGTPLRPAPTPLPVRPGWPYQ